MSDTHDRLPAIKAALQCFAQRGVDTLIHAGDVVAPFAAKLLSRFPGSAHVIYGNNDGERAGLKRVLPQIQDGPLMIELDGRRVLVQHWIRQCREEDMAAADVIVTGHTHEARVERRDGKLLVNPGECCGWISGRCTVAVLDLETNEVEQIEVLA